MGNIFSADEVNNRIRKIASTRVVTTGAGSGVSGYVDAGRISVQFQKPYGVAVTTHGNIYVSDWGNNRIRKITASTSSAVINYNSPFCQFNTSPQNVTITGTSIYTVYL